MLLVIGKSFKVRVVFLTTTSPSTLLIIFSFQKSKEVELTFLLRLKNFPGKEDISAFDFHTLLNMFKRFLNSGWISFSFQDYAKGFRLNFESAIL